ncbi:MAG TPA: hypothetical protein VGS58_19450 [Candidatus Sulfopaludibacter sp.]|nr:hypothetical protein [Candidatus Sulfopaludibacter sp.]
MRQLVAISLVVIGAAPAVLGQVETPVTREGRFWVGNISGSVPIGTAERFRLDTTGNVVLRGEAGGAANYTLKLRVEARDAREAAALFRQVEVRGRNQGGLAYLVVNPPRRISEAPELTLAVPRILREVRIETRGGNVQASGLDGQVEARSLGGRISVDGIRGAAEIRTGGGDIQVGSVGGPLRCYSGGGVIRVQNGGAECWLETAGGEIFLHDANGPVHASTAGGNIRIDRSAGAVFARTAAGLIQVQQAGGLVTAESSGGAIQVSAANGVRCDSAGGAIRLRNVAGALRASTSAGSIMAELANGHRMEDSSLSTNAGDVTVFISSNLPVTVLARNQSGGAGRIISDFPEIRVRQAGDAAVVPVVAEGALNGGGPTLRINVIGGTIYLRKQK